MASGVLADLLQEVTRRLVPAAVLLLLAVPATARGQSTAICHASNDPNTPYQQIEVPPEATMEHLGHPDDIVPAPPEGCPAQAVVDEPDPAPTATVQPDVVPAPQQPARRRAPRRRPRRPRAQAAPAVTTGNLRATASVDAETLPMTGAEISLIALMGTGFLLAGGGLRLRLRG